MESGKAFLLQALALSRISSQKSYREAVRLEKVEVWHHNFFLLSDFIVLGPCAGKSSIFVLS
jgi:hypothetical protein